MYSTSNSQRIKKALNLPIIGLIILGCGKILWGGIVRFNPVMVMEHDDFITASGVFSLSGLLQFFSIIFIGVGIYKMYKNSEYISPSHKTKVTAAGILLLINFFVVFMIRFTGSGFESYYIIYRSLTRTTTWGYFISSIIFGSIIVLLVYEIVNKRHKNYLYGLFTAYLIINFVFMWGRFTFPSGVRLHEFLIRGGTYSMTEGIFSLLFAGMFYVVRENLKIPMMTDRSNYRSSPYTEQEDDTHQPDAESLDEDSISNDDESKLGQEIGYDISATSKDESKMTFLGFLGLSVIVIFVVSFLCGWVAEDAIGNWWGVDQSEFMIGFFIVLSPLGLSIFGLLYSNSRYEKVLANARSHIPTIELLISIAVLFSYLYFLGSNPGDPISEAVWLVSSYNLFGLFLIGAYGVGKINEKRTILNRINEKGKLYHKIEDISYYFGIKENSVKKHITNLLSRRKVDGFLDKKTDCYITKTLKENVLEFLRENIQREVIPFSEVSNEFEIPQEVVIAIIHRLKVEMDLKGELDRLNDVYRLDDNYTSLVVSEEEKTSVGSGVPSTSSVREISEQKTEKTPRSRTEIKEKMTQLKEEEEMIDLRGVESALNEGDLQRARDIISQIEERFEEYNVVLDELKSVDDDLSALSQKLARGQISDESFKSAKRALENRKFDLEEQLNKLRQKVIYEDYQKPF